MGGKFDTGLIFFSPRSSSSSPGNRTGFEVVPKGRKPLSDPCKRKRRLSREERERERERKKEEGGEKETEEVSR